MRVEELLREALSGSSESDVSDAGACANTVLKRDGAGPPPVLGGVGNATRDQVFVNSASGVVHVSYDGAKLLCARPLIGECKSNDVVTGSVGPSCLQAVRPCSVTARHVKVSFWSSFAFLAVCASAKYLCVMPYAGEQNQQLQTSPVSAWGPRPYGDGNCGVPRQSYPPWCGKRSALDHMPLAGEHNRRPQTRPVSASPYAGEHNRQLQTRPVSAWGPCRKRRWNLRVPREPKPPWCGKRPALIICHMLGSVTEAKATNKSSFSVGAVLVGGFPNIPSWCGKRPAVEPAIDNPVSAQAGEHDQQLQTRPVSAWGPCRKRRWNFWGSPMLESTLRKWICVR